MKAQNYPGLLRAIQIYSALGGLTALPSRVRINIPSSAPSVLRGGVRREYSYQLASALPYYGVYAATNHVVAFLRGHWPGAQRPGAPEG